MNEFRKDATPIQNLLLSGNQTLHMHPRLWIKFTKGCVFNLDFLWGRSTNSTFEWLLGAFFFHNEGAKKLAEDHLHVEFSRQRWCQSPTLQYKEMLTCDRFFKLSSKWINISFVGCLVVEARVFYQVIDVYEHTNFGVQVVPCNLADDEDDMDF